MTDNPTNVPGTNPAISGTPQPSIDPLPSISYSEAESRKAELFANEEWRTRFFSGSVEAKREWDQIVRGLTAPPPAPANDREAVLEQLKRFAVISPDVAQEVLDGRPASPAEHEGARQLREHLFNDEDWIERYNKGDLRARQQVEYINLILSKPVRDNPSQP